MRCIMCDDVQHAEEVQYKGCNSVGIWCSISCVTFGISDKFFLPFDQSDAVPKCAQRIMLKSLLELRYSAPPFSTALLLLSTQHLSACLPTTPSTPPLYSWLPPNHWCLPPPPIGSERAWSPEKKSQTCANAAAVPRLFPNIFRTFGAFFVSCGEVDGPYGTQSRSIGLRYLLKGQFYGPLQRLRWKMGCGHAKTVEKLRHCSRIERTNEPQMRFVLSKFFHWVDVYDNPPATKNNKK